MNKSDLQTALLILPEDYRQTAFEFLSEHPNYAPEDFVDFIKDQLDQMQHAYEYELHDKDDEIASPQNDYEASEYGYDDLQDEFEDLNDDYDKLNDDYDKLEEELLTAREEKEALAEYALGLKDALDKAGVYVELKQPSCLLHEELMNFYSRG